MPFLVIMFGRNIARDAILIEEEGKRVTPQQWRTGRERAGLTQVDAACSLGISQPYLSQLEKGLRLAGPLLVKKAARLFNVPTALPLPVGPSRVFDASPDELQAGLASLGYPGFEHVRPTTMINPAMVVLNAVVKTNLDTRLVEALPWVLINYTDLDWDWLRDHAKLSNAQNRLGYLLYLAEETVRTPPNQEPAARVLSQWKGELEAARLANEGTLCRDSMPDAERRWLREHRNEEAAHWHLLTGLSADQLRYARQ